MPVRSSREGNKFVVHERAGKTRFVHETAAGAKRQEAAINIALARMRGKKIPLKR